MTYSGRLLKTLLPATVAGLFVGFAFVFFFTSALHDPKPDGMKVGIVAPAPVRAEVGAQLDQAIPGGIELVSYPSPADAREAVASRRSTGRSSPTRRNRG